MTADHRMTRRRADGRAMRIRRHPTHGFASEEDSRVAADLIPGADHSAIEEQLRKNAAQDFEAHGEIIEYDPPKLLVWTWCANWHKDPDHVTGVRWEVTPTTHGSLVRVTHSGLANEPLLRKDYGGGWKGMLALLRGFVSETVGR